MIKGHLYMKHEFFVRPFIKGDEVPIIRLWNDSYKNYGGYAQRFPEYWNWCCLQRPDVENNGVILVLDKCNGELAGYVVVGKSGSLWELCYNQKSDGEVIVTILLNQAIAYLNNINAPSIKFLALESDPIIRRVSRELGFTACRPPQMFLSILNLRSLVSAIVSDKASSLKKEFNETLLIKVKGSPFWLNDTLVIKINGEGVNVGNIPQETTVSLETDYFTLSSLLFGNTTPLSALLRLKLKARPLFKIPIALKMLSSLQLHADWAFQLSDYG